MKKLLLIIGLFITFQSAFAQTEVPRYTLLEAFSSSTCPPCKPGNERLKTVLAENDAQDGKYTVIKYQMSWPSPGDPYYTAEGNAKRSLYSVNGVPSLFMDGGPNVDPRYLNHSQLLEKQAMPSYVEVSGKYNVIGQTVYTKIDIKPTDEITGGNNLRLFVAIVEKRTENNRKNNGETEFFQVMKKFMPHANGTMLAILRAYETVTKEFTWEFKGNYRLPANASSPINHNTEHSVEDFDNLEVVAWVQNISTKETFNSGTAILDNNSYTVNFDMEDKSGTLTATVDAEPIASGDEFEAGLTAVFTATPNEGYVVKEWKLNGEVVHEYTAKTLSVMLWEETTVSVEFKEAIGIIENNLTEVELFPNPVANELTINNAEHVQKVTITNTLGQIVKEEILTGNATAVISTQNLSAGVFFVVLKNNEGFEITKKIIKQ
ncbi:MAG: T9SS type A sorting domain-containing protein [Lentimicrobiaceae bacterium]|nr:T9SS type A sorting domain-containing protein [Lentimicrobiaceae bacterium]